MSTKSKSKVFGYNFKIVDKFPSNLADSISNTLQYGIKILHFT